MLELLLTPAVFSRGLHLYYCRYENGNATTEQWVACMEEVSGLPLQRMARLWLHRTGYPQVTATCSYDGKSGHYSVTFTQSGFQAHAEGPEELRGPWPVPIAWALVKEGTDTHSGIFFMTAAAETLTVQGVVAPPDFCSLARDWSFFGTMTVSTASQEQLQLQARSDLDVVNRYFAYRRLAEEQKAAVVTHLAAVPVEGSLQVSSAWAALHGQLLLDEGLPPASRYLLLQEGKSLQGHPELEHLYGEAVTARTAMLQAVCAHHGPAVLRLYRSLAAAAGDGSEGHLPGLPGRALKQHLFDILAAGSKAPVLPSVGGEQEDQRAPIETMEVVCLAEALVDSPFVTDQHFGFVRGMELCPPGERRRALQARVRELWTQHPSTTIEYISALSGLDCEDSHEVVRALLDDPVVNLNLAGHARTICRGWTSNRHRALLTAEGLKLTVELLLRVGRVNQMSAGSILQAFNDLRCGDAY